MTTADKNPVVGIDLGTTNSAVAVVGDDGVTIIPVQGQSTMPSAVGIDPAGRLVVGQAAKNQSISSPESTVLSIKRHIGTEHTVQLGGKSYRPEEISAIILGELKRAAESHLGCPVNRAVITVPAFFNEHQRQATQDAGRLAGLEVLRIINEPTAAALAYGAGSASDQPAENLLVYDLGGGTFDVSVVSVENGVVEVRSSHGDTHLGGDDFDELLAGLAETRFQEVHRGAEGEITAATRRRLKAVMENAKINLSTVPFVSVHEEYLTTQAHLRTEFSREEYEKLIAPLLQKTLECLQRALKDAVLTAADIGKILLVGGSTRTPLVQEIIEDRLGIVPRHEIDPDLIVAMGAAIQASSLAGRPAPAILVDVTAHSYGVDTLVESFGPFGMPSYRVVCSHLIRRGTPLPVRKAKVFYTFEQDQEMVKIGIYQGESEEPSRNLKLGELVVEGLSKGPAQSEIVVGFQIDLNGLLHVEATEKRTGLNRRTTIDTAGHHRINLDAARENLSALFAEMDEREAASHPDDDEEDSEAGEAPDTDAEFEDEAEISTDAEGGDSVHDFHELLSSAKSLRRRAEALLPSASESDAAAIRSLLDEISTAIAGKNTDVIAAAVDKLSDVLFYLED